jgi:hypothetical protein
MLSGLELQVESSSANVQYHDQRIDNTVHVKPETLGPYENHCHSPCRAQRELSSSVSTLVLRDEDTGSSIF